MEPSSLVFLGLMVGVFYFLLIRPQQKRLKQHQALIGSLRLGDEVVTIGGLFGTVRRMDESSVWLEAAEGTVIRFSRQAVSKKVDDEESESPVNEVLEDESAGDTRDAAAESRDSAVDRRDN